MKRLKHIFLAATLLLAASTTALAGAATAKAAKPTAVVSKETPSLPSVANDKPVENAEAPIFGRECCSAKLPQPDGFSVKITACAGWFLSDSEKAYDRACAKLVFAAWDFMLIYY